MKRLDEPSLSSYALPAQTVPVEADVTTGEKLADALRRNADWSVRVDAKIARWQVIAFAPSVSASALVGYLGYLLNAGPQVTLRPTEAQTAVLRAKLSRDRCERRLFVEVLISSAVTR